MRISLLFSMSTAFAVGLAGLAGLAGCGGDDDGPAADPSCFDYGSFQAGTDEVSLAREVMPVLQGSCTFGNSCHGTTTGSKGLVYLGPVLGATASVEQLEEMLEQTVDVEPVIEAGMPLITPGDPAQSFLMHKTDGTLECAVLACAADGSCGQPMPYTKALAPLEERNVIRRWIAQGAQLN